MDIIKTLNHFWLKPESKPIQQSAAPVNEKESEEVSKLQSEIAKAKEVIAAWRSEAEKLKDELTKTNDLVSDLKKKNYFLRATNYRRWSEINVLKEKNRKLKANNKAKREIDFDKYFEVCASQKCDFCIHERTDCKKYDLGDGVSVCIRRRPFRETE